MGIDITARSLALKAARQFVKRPQFVATRGLVPVSGSAVATNNLVESRYTVKAGPSRISQLRFGFWGCKVDLSAAGELPQANGYSAVCAVERLSPNIAPVKSLNGAQVLPVSAGAGFFFTDPLGIVLNANEQFKVQTEHRLAVAGTDFPSTLNPAGSVSEAYRSALGTGQVGTPGTWSSAGRSGTSGLGVPPIIIGIPEIPFPAVLIVGDSIATSVGDTVSDAFGNYGFIPKGLYAGGPAGVAVPYCRASQSGEAVSTLTSGGYTKRLALAQFCTHIICNLGSNDVNAGVSLATLKTQYVIAWDILRAAGALFGIKLHQVLIMPKTTSTDSWATLVNQTPVAGFAAGGVREQINDWIKLQVGIHIDGYIDPNTGGVQDATQTDKWVVNGTPNYATADGTHPASAGHNLASASVASAASLFSV